MHWSILEIFEDEFQGFIVWIFKNNNCMLLVYYLSEVLKAHWFTTLVKYSRNTGLLP